MGTTRYACGCSFTTSMFRSNEVITICLCSVHEHLRAPDKTLKQMTDELRAQLLAHEPEPVR